MFNNANVIFRTKFIDGVSTVHRISNNENRVGEKANAKVPERAKKRGHPIREKMIQTT